MAEKIVEHIGKIISINGNMAKVEIISKSACSSCHAAGMCSASDAVTKVIDAYIGDNHYNVGDEVTVYMKRSLGTKAVILSYIIPLVILMILVLSLSLLNLSELKVGLFSLLGLVIYYLVIYLFRNKIAKDYVFYIR